LNQIDIPKTKYNDYPKQHKFPTHSKVDV